MVHNALLKINQWSISGVLDGAPYDASLNGSLWLLGGILLCYVVAAALAALRGHGECRQLLAALTLGALLFHVLHATNRATSYPELPSFTVLSPFFRYGTAFLVGMCLRVWPTLAASGRPAVVAYAAVFVVLLEFGGFVLVAPVLIPALVITFGNAFVAPLPVDLSFGIFIYAFPVQQLMAALPIVSKSFTGFFLAALVLATALAASAHFLLERTLRRPAHARPL